MTQTYVKPSRSVTNALIRPHITERATALATENAYVFVIQSTASKRDVIAAVKALYKVTPRKVTTVTIPSKNRVGRKGIKGVQKGYKKAIVYVKKGESITIS